jgi:hypothetical protein
MHFLDFPTDTIYRTSDPRVVIVGSLKTILQKMLVTCDACGYEWPTGSQLYYVSCPRCRHSLRIREIERKQQQVPQPGQDSTQVQAARTAPERSGDRKGK